MNLDTPGKLISHLIGYINDDLAIVAHVRRDFNATITVADVQRKRRLQYRPKVMNYEPLSTGEQADWEKAAQISDRCMVDRLNKVRKTA